MGQSGHESESAARVAPLPPRPSRRSEDFYIAGGPIAPDRACYIPRLADRQLHERLRAGDYCHVIAPRFSGKSSLVARTATRLRTEGCLAAVVDLSQLGGREGSTEAGRWYYALAYRVQRDLRLKFDLQAWWQERMPLPPAQRLGEFFWEIVLGQTRAPVVVFLDEIDSVEQLEYVTELFNTVRACHDARAAEPEYERLSFALLGAAMPAGTAAKAARAATEIGVHLELPDFRFEEARLLAPGLRMPAGDAERALYRVIYWTGGHPYLTQKLCQAVARNATRVDSDAAVDRLVAARFLARNAVSTESSMTRVLDGLERSGKLARPALRRYRRIRRGRRPRYDPDSPEHELLRVCGLVTVTADRRLVVRNRIYAEVFGHRWTREALPPDWRRIGRVAAMLALLAATIWVYLEVLPRPYEETLRVISVEPDEALEAWSAMRRIPGFSGRADRLLARVLIRRSRLETDWQEAAAIDAQLRGLPGFQPRADALLVEFWERRAIAAEAAEQRDEALLYRLRAYHAGPTADAGLAAELAGGDYRQLLAVIRPAGLVEALAPSADGRSVVTVSAGNVVERWESVTGLPEPGSRLELLVEEFVPLRRRLSLDLSGRVTALSMNLEIDHPRPADLSLGLVAPSGKRVELVGTQGRARNGRLEFDEQVAPELRTLRGEQALGTWVLEIEDRVTGAAGYLGGWNLRASQAAGHLAADRPENSLLIPDPARSSSVRVALSPLGMAVAATPRNPAARGRLQVWNVTTGQPLASMRVGAGERWLGFAGDDSLLIAESGAGTRLRVLDVRSAEQRFEHLSVARLAAAPAISPDGKFIAVAEATPQAVWIRSLEAGRETFRMPAGEVMAVAVASQGGLLAIADTGNVVRLWRTSDRSLLGEFPHGAAVVAIRFDPAGRWLVTADAANHVRVWSSAAPAAQPVLARPGDPLQQFGFDASGGSFATLGPARGFEVWALPDATPIGPVLRHAGDGAQPSRAGEPPAGTALLSSDGKLMVTGRGTRSVRVWQVSQSGAPLDLPRLAPVVALAPSGLRTAAGFLDGRVILRARDPDSLALRQVTVTSGEARHGGEVTALVFSPDGTRLASVAADGSVLLWHAATGRRAGGLFHHGSGQVGAVDLGPDGRLLVTGGEFGARAWNAESGEPGPTLGPVRRVSAVTVDPAGRHAYTATPSGELESWDLESGERRWAVEIESPVSVIAVSSDGRQLVVGGRTGRVQTRGAGAGERPLSQWLAAPVIAVQFAPDGRSILAQTPAWIHRLGIEKGRLEVLGSRLLPGAAPPGAWRSATPDGLRLVRVGGARSETLAVVDFERAPLPPEDWNPDLEAWQQRLKMYFSMDGALRHGVPPAPLSTSPQRNEEATGDLPADPVTLSAGSSAGGTG